MVLSPLEKKLREPTKQSSITKELSRNDNLKRMFEGRNRTLNEEMFFHQKYLNNYLNI